jgi:alpha-tubulin suppressor-like RCC1 family protein
MPLTKLQAGSFETGAIDTSDLSSNATIAFSSTSAFANALAPKITTVNVANSAFSILDDTAVNIGGGYIVVTGANFQSGASVLIDTTPASAVTFVNTSILRVQVPARSAASYNLYVVNPDGGTGIRVAGLNYSTEPIWVTSSPLSNQSANTAFNVTLSATGATSYSVAAGSTLPAGTSLLANGYFSGTVTIGAQTTYTFSVVATDAELQDSSKTFQVTVTVTPSYSLWLNGYNPYGQLGQNNIVDRSSPVQVGTDNIWSQFVAHNYGAIALKPNGTLWGWGEASRLPFNDAINRSSPVQIGSSSDWASISTGKAIKSNGTLWAWGAGSYGFQGQNDQVARSSPTQVGTGTNWAQVYSSTLNTIAIKTDGTLWAWGYNGFGNLGQNNQIERSSPVQIGATTDWSKISNHGNGVLAVKTNGTLWGWGITRTNTVYQLSPTQIGASTNWSNVYSSEMSTAFFATKTDGTLWAWGTNTQGQLGNNNTNNLTSPLQIGSESWTAISPGILSVGIKSNGTLWWWGRDYYAFGPFNTYRSSPVQVGSGTTWYSLPTRSLDSWVSALKS